MTSQELTPSSGSPLPASLTQMGIRARKAADPLIVWIDNLSDWMAPPDTDPLGSPTGIARRPIVFGLWTMLIVFLGIGLWAGVVPLASAAIARGKVVLDSNRKTIQHLEGGIIDKILVSEGGKVEKGQTLVRLNETAAKTRYDLYFGQYNTSLATEARLVAERDGLEAPIFPPELLKVEQSNPAIAEILDSQRRLFASRKEALDGQLNILHQKSSQFTEEIHGLEAQVESATRQIALLDEEIEAVATLLKQGNAQKPRLLALQRAQADLKGQQGEDQARIARARQSIAEADLAISNQKTEFNNKVIADLKDTQQQLADLSERIRASGDIMDRIIISSPISGIVTDLRVHTIGGVISPGEKIMDIVPNDKLVIEALISPQDIDVVKPDLLARVHLTAYSSRRLPPVEGKVIHVSADSFEDQRTGTQYFKARIEIDPKSLAALGTDVELTPGMMADVQIVTGERTLLSYLVSPIRDSFYNAFREQ